MHANQLSIRHGSIYTPFNKTLLKHWAFGPAQANAGWAWAGLWGRVARPGPGPKVGPTHRVAAKAEECGGKIALTASMCQARTHFQRPRNALPYRSQVLSENASFRQ